MKVLICIGHVPDTTSRIKFTDDDTKFDTTDIQYVVGPYEELGLTRLLEIKTQIPTMKITAINVGLVDTEPTLRKALAIGADEAIRVNTEAVDAFTVAKQISEVFKSGEYDFIVTGKESIDYNGGQVDGMIAELLNIPSVSGAAKFEIDGDKAIIDREIDAGIETVETSFPFVTSAQKGFAKEPKIPNMRGIMQARRKKLTIIEPVEQNTVTQTGKHYLPEAKGACKIIDAENVQELVRLLHEEAKAI